MKDDGTTTGLVMLWKYLVFATSGLRSTNELIWKNFRKKRTNPNPKRKNLHICK